MGETWRIVFFANDRFLELDEFLRRKLDKAYGHGLGHGGRVIIEHGLRGRDESYKVAEWVRHEFDEKLRYIIIGYDEAGRIVFLSYCHACRSLKTPHYEHSK